MDRPFQAKVALITGSTQGIGAAVARHLATEGAAGVVVCGRDRQRGAGVMSTLLGLGSEAIFVAVDLADPADCQQLVAATDEHFGRIDILVNAAGLSTRGSILDTTVELWDDLMAVNVRAPFLLMQGAIRIMRREKIAGSIVNVGSVSAYGSIPILTPYATTKGALMTLTRNVAYSVMWDRIRVNQINPGWMDTPGEDAVQRRFHSAGDDWLVGAEAAQPFGRLIKPDELARAIAFLASAESGMMTGAIVDFDQSVQGAGPQPIPPRDSTPL